MDFLTDFEFRDLARAGAVPQGAGVRAAFAAQATDAGARIIEVIASTAALDTHGTTFAPSGWKLERFRRNPIISWAHRRDLLPIGRAREIAVVNDALRAEIEFTPEGMNAFADQVLALVRAGFLRGASVGFYPIKWAFSTDPARRGQLDFIQQELYEISLVPIPSNPETLVSRRDAGEIERDLLAELIALEVLK